MGVIRNVRLRRSVKSVQSVAYFIFRGVLRLNKSSTNAALEFFFEIRHKLTALARDVKHVDGAMPFGCNQRDFDVAAVRCEITDAMRYSSPNASCATISMIVQRFENSWSKWIGCREQPTLSSA